MILKLCACVILGITLLLFCSLANQEVQYRRECLNSCESSQTEPKDKDEDSKIRKKRKISNGNGTKICIICLVEVENQKICLPCSHEFHKDCLKKWFREQEHSYTGKTCPICRGKVNTTIVSQAI